MANNQTIQGANVAIDIEKSAFDKGIKQVQGELTSSKKYANALDQALRLDPTSVELMNKKLATTEDQLILSQQKTILLQDELDQVDEALDIKKFNELSAKIQQSVNETTRLQKETQRLSSDIAAIETEQYDELSNKTKYAAKSTGQLSAEQLGLNNSANDASASLLEQTGIMDKMPAAITPVTAAMAGLAGAATLVTKNYRESMDIQREYSAVLVETSVSTEEATDATKIFADMMGIEVSEATEIGKGALKLYGEEISSVDEMVNGMISTYGILLSDTLSVEEAQSLLNSAMNTFGLELEEANNLVFTSIELFQDYGKQADDIADTFREWGDTFVDLGFTAEEFFDILETGLVLGAKNTDEVANAFNELVINIAEGGDEVEQALADIGLDLGTLQEQLNSGESAQAFVDIVNGLAAIEDQTIRTTIAGVLFGTMGEEWIATLAGNEEAVNALNESLAIMSAREVFVAKIASPAMLESLVANAEQLGLTSVEAENLAYQIETTGFASLSTGLKLIVLKNALLVAGEQGVITEEQLLGVQTQMDTLRDSNASANEKLAIMVGLLEKLNEKGLITEEQFAGWDKLFTDFADGGLRLADEQLNKLDQHMQDLINSSGEFTTDSVPVLVESTSGYTEVVEKASWETLNFDQKIKALGDANIITAEQVPILSDAVSVLTSESSTAIDKLNAQITVLDELSKANIITKESADEYTKTLEEYIKVLETGSTSNDDMTQQLLDISEETATASEEFDEFEQKLDDSIKASDKLQSSLEESKSDMSNFAGETSNAAAELAELNAEMDAYNSKSMSAPPSSSSGKSVGRQTLPFSTIDTRQATTIPAPITTNNSSTNITLAPNITFNGDINSSVDVENVVMDAMIKIGRLI